MNARTLQLVSDCSRLRLAAAGEKKTYQFSIKLFFPMVAQVELIVSPFMPIMQASTTCTSYSLAEWIFALSIRTIMWPITWEWFNYMTHRGDGEPRWNDEVCCNTVLVQTKCGDHRCASERIGKSDNSRRRWTRDLSRHMWRKYRIEMEIRKRSWNGANERR